MVLMSVVTLATQAQSNSIDNTTSFKVFGTCVQCKNRIQESLKIKGIAPQPGMWKPACLQLLIRLLFYR